MVYSPSGSTHSTDCSAAQTAHAERAQQVAQRYFIAVAERSAGTTGPVTTAGGVVSGNAIRGTPGVPNWPASHGSAATKTRSANGQSCLPGWGSTPQSMPLARPSAHSE